jgi:hypothetical protein
MRPRGQHPDVVSAGVAAGVTGTMVVALYDPVSGRIHHLHHVLVHEGAAEVTEESAVDAAKAHASRLGHDPSALQVAVSGDPEHGRAPHRIAVDTGLFVRVPDTERRPGNGTAAASSS